MIDWPDPDFALYSTSSPHRRDQPDDAPLAEIETTIATLADEQRPPLAKGLLTAADAARAGATLAAIHADLAHRHGMPPHGPTPGITWRDKIICLRAAIEHRRANWPGDVAKGLRSRAEAIRRLAAIEAAHDYYWTCLLWIEGGIETARAFEAMLDARHRAAA